MNTFVGLPRSILRSEHSHVGLTALSVAVELRIIVICVFESLDQSFEVRWTFIAAIAVWVREEITHFFREYQRVFLSGS